MCSASHCITGFWQNAWTLVEAKPDQRSLSRSRDTSQGELRLWKYLVWACMLCRWWNNYYFTGWQKNIIIIDKNLVTHSSLLICLGHLACKRQTLLLAHGRWGKFHEEEHPRLSSRNSILMMSINVNIINLVVIGLEMQICSILCFSWSILVKCCVHLRMSSSKTQMLPLEKTRFHKYWLFC